MTDSKDTNRRLAENRKARFEYELLDELECGLELCGTEVKALRTGEASIAEAFAMIRRGELFLVNSHIPEYRQGNVHNHEPRRERKLLVHKKELAAWEARVKEKGITMVPLALYFVGQRVKLRLGLCRGKKLFDKRASVREREDKREMARAVQRRRD
jgi:SsrA-binding protein